jgi:hypothetical protein
MIDQQSTDPNEQFRQSPPPPRFITRKTQAVFTGIAWLIPTFALGLAINAPAEPPRLIGWLVLTGLVGASLGALSGALGWAIGRRVRGTWLATLMDYHWSLDPTLGSTIVGGVCSGFLAPIWDKGALLGTVYRAAFGALVGAAVSLFEYFSARYGFLPTLGAVVGGLNGAVAGLVAWFLVAIITSMTIGVVYAAPTHAFYLGTILGAIIGGLVGRLIDRK